MAIRLLAALVALGLLHLLPQLARWHVDGLQRRWVAALGDLHGAVRVLVLAGVPVVLCLLLATALHHAFLGDLALLALDVLVLLFCFGPRAFEADLETILAAPDRREAIDCLAHLIIAVNLKESPAIPDEKGGILHLFDVVLFLVDAGLL